MKFPKQKTASSGPVQILAVSHSAAIGGAELSLLSALAGLRGSRNLSVRVSLPAEGPLANRLEDKGLRPLYPGAYTPWLSRSANEARLKRYPRMTLNRLFARSFARRLGVQAPDLVWANTLATPFGYLLSQALGVPLVWHVREFVHPEFGVHWDLGEDRSMGLLSRSAAVVFTTEALAAAYRPFLGDTPTHVIPNGIEFGANPDPSTAAPKPRPGRPLRLLCVAKIAPLKGLSDALSALAHLKGKGVEAELRFAGAPTSHCETLKDLAVKLGVSDAVRWLSFCDDVAPLYEWADMTLLCSLREAFGRVSIESLAAGVPVVGTNSGGTPEVLGKFGEGLLYDPGDSRELAARILGLLENPELYLRIANEAPADVRERFSHDTYVARLEQLLLETHAASKVSP